MRWVKGIYRNKFTLPIINRNEVLRRICLNEFIDTLFQINGKTCAHHDYNNEFDPFMMMWDGSICESSSQNKFDDDLIPIGKSGSSNGGVTIRFRLISIMPLTIGVLSHETGERCGESYVKDTSYTLVLDKEPKNSNILQLITCKEKSDCLSKYEYEKFKSDSLIDLENLKNQQCKSMLEEFSKDVNQPFDVLSKICDCNDKEILLKNKAALTKKVPSMMLYVSNKFQGISDHECELLWLKKVSKMSYQGNEIEYKNMINSIFKNEGSKEIKDFFMK